MVLQRVQSSTGPTGEPSPEMQLFIGMITVHHKADVGIFVTTSTLTRHAAALASEHSPLVRVIDGAILASMLSNP